MKATSKTVWTGRILSGTAALFLSFDAGVKLLQHPVAVEGTAQLGYPTSILFGLGLVQAIFLVLYLIPRTSLLGSILWTGYLGGAVATHVRLGNPLFTHTLSPVYVAVLLFAGLWLRDNYMRAMFPIRATKASALGN